jgi:hypothetical protein
MLLWIAHARNSALCDYPLAFCLILVQDAASDEALLDLSRLITVLLDAHLDFVLQSMCCTLLWFTSSCNVFTRALALSLQHKQMQWQLGNQQNLPHPARKVLSCYKGSVRYASIFHGPATAAARKSRLSGGGRCREIGRFMLVRPVKGTASRLGSERRVVPDAVCGRPFLLTSSPSHIDASLENRWRASGGGFWRDGGRCIACLVHTVASSTGSPGDIGRADCTRRVAGVVNRSPFSPLARSTTLASFAGPRTWLSSASRCLARSKPMHLAQRST